MEDKVKEFLESGRLEAYVYGTLDEVEQQEVEKYIEQYPAINSEYQTLQNQLEATSMLQAKKAPLGMKSQIMDALPDKTKPTKALNSSWTKYLAIAGFAASLILGFGWFNTNNNLQQEKENYTILASDCEEREQQMDAQNQLIAFLNSEQTQRFEMKGNDLSPNFRAMVFVNEALGKVILNPTKPVTLPHNKCLQLWGDLEGEMIPIAVLDDVDQKNYNLDINPEFTSLNLTIEEKTDDRKGQLHPDVTQLIASVLI